MKCTINELCLSARKIAEEAKALQRKLDELSEAAEKVGLDLTVENGELTFENEETYVKRYMRRKWIEDRDRSDATALFFLMVLLGMVTGYFLIDHFDIIKNFIQPLP